MRSGLSGWMNKNAEVLELLAFWKLEQQVVHRFQIWRPHFKKTKINNANGTKNDVNKELNAFLDYIAGKESENSFVQKLKEAVKKAKKNRNWRLEFMTLLIYLMKEYDI